MTALLVAIALLGLVVGSFLNVVIYRVPRGESLLRPASHCIRCEQPLRWWHNVPVVSWIVLRGRCGHCHEPISIRYPLVEAGTAALFVAVTLRLGLSLTLPAYLYLAAVSIALAMIDFDVRRLPNAIVLPSYLVAALLLVPAAAVHGDWRSPARALIAMAALWTFFFAIRFVYPAGMGYGDVKLAGLLGLYLGWLGWSSVLVGMMSGFVLGSFVGVALMLIQRAGRKTAIPFGPYLLAGALLAPFIAGPIATWYGGLLVPVQN
jgi:leader peptidase (prepilin peptidase)/N-methyltransferase